MDKQLCKYCNKPKDQHYHDIFLNRYACWAGQVVASLLTFEPKQILGL